MLKTQKSFEMMSVFQSEIGNIFDLQFSMSDDYIRFKIKSDSIPKDNYDWTRISAGETSNQEVKFIGISEKNGIIAEYKHEQFVIKKSWIISFEGKKSNPHLKQILSLENINLDNLNTIENILKETNSICFEKNDSIIMIRYAGHWGENYNYVSPIADFNPNNNWNKLSEKWYSFHYKDGLFCGYTDW